MAGSQTCSSQHRDGGRKMEVGAAVLSQVRELTQPKTSSKKNIVNVQKTLFSPAM